MPFKYRFSRIAGELRPSPIRELFKMTQRPGMISFAGGLPDPAIFPVEQFARCAGALTEHGKVALQYSASEGYRPLVDELCARMAAPLGRPIVPEEMVIGTGSQQVMDMLARVLVDPGDVIVVEAPTYPGALHTFRAAGARFAAVPCDADGMLVDRLPAVLEACLRSTGRPPAFIYTVVNFGNPSGASLATARRRRLVEIAAEWRVPVFEDDPYGELRFGEEVRPSLFSLAPAGGVLFASSFSKILAPGVRVAWAVGDRDLIRRMVIVKQAMDLCTPAVAQVLVHEYCRLGFLDGHLPQIRRHYADKAAAMQASLCRHLPGGRARWHQPEGGFFFWLELPGLDSEVLFRRAVEAGVAFLPGRAFFTAPAETVGDTVDAAPWARLCFTFASPDQIDEGCRRLAAALP